MSVRLSVYPHGTTLLPQDGFSWNFIFEDFSKICLETSSFIKIWQELRVLCMKTNVHFFLYLAHFFLEWEKFRTNVLEKIKKHILCSVTFFFFRKSCRYEIIWKNMAHVHCMLDNWGNKYTHSGCVILIAFPLQQWLHERASLLRYKYISCLVTIDIFLDEECAWGRKNSWAYGML